MKIKLFDRAGDRFTQVSVNYVLCNIYPNGKEGDFNEKEHHYIHKKQCEFLKDLGEKTTFAAFSHEREWHGVIKCARHYYALFIEDEGPTFGEYQKLINEDLCYESRIKELGIDIPEDDDIDIVE